MFRHTPPQVYIRSALHRYTATRRRPAERREGLPWTPSGHAPIFERGAVGASRKPSASAGLFPSRAARRKIPGLNRGASSTIAQTHYAIVKKKGTGVRVRGNPCRICVNEKT